MQPFANETPPAVKTEVKTVVEPSPPQPLFKSHPVDYTACGESLQSRQLAKLIVQDSEQQRLVIRCDKLLSEIAAEKAKEMAISGDVTHKGIYGGPNKRLLNANYPLDNAEHQLFNTVEAVMGGEEYPDEVWLSFQASYPHKTHLLAELPFYLEQTQLGVGYYRKIQSPHVDYWVVYFAKRQTE